MGAPFNFRGGEKSLKEIIIGYFVLVNLALMLVMKMDKARAENHRYRISEKTLWIMALIGGAIGGTLGMQQFRHKTKHKAFMIGFPILAIVDVMVIIILLSTIKS